MELTDFSSLTITDVQFLPIVKEYAHRINLVDTINHMVNTEMELQPGPVILGMVLDTLSGRSPLYRLKEFFDEKDTELLLGETVSLEQFTDHNIGRALDKIFETGTQKIFGQLSQNAVNGFQIKPTGAHYDTTSVSVYGDYTLTENAFVYVADSAFVTQDNLKKAGDKTKFISRLPATYKEWDQRFNSQPFSGIFSRPISRVAIQPLIF